MHDLLSDPNQLAALLGVLEILRSPPSTTSPDAGTLPSNFASGGFATPSGQIPVSPVTGRTLGGMPFTPNPIAQGIASAGALFGNTRAALQTAREREERERRQRAIEELTRVLLESVRPQSGQPDTGQSAAEERVGLGTGRRLPATRGGRRIT